MSRHSRSRDDVLRQMFASIEEDNFANFDTCFEPDAVIWHNFDQTEISVDHAGQTLQDLCELTTERCYADQRIRWCGDEAFCQHVLTGVLRSGTVFQLPVFMRIVLSESHLIQRIDEYFDTRQTDCLTEEASRNPAAA